MHQEHITDVVEIREEEAMPEMATEYNGAEQEDQSAYVTNNIPKTGVRMYVKMFISWF